MVNATRTSGVVVVEGSPGENDAYIKRVVPAVCPGGFYPAPPLNLRALLSKPAAPTSHKSPPRGPGRGGSGKGGAMERQWKKRRRSVVQLPPAPPGAARRRSHSHPHPNEIPPLPPVGDASTRARSAPTHAVSANRGNPLAGIVRSLTKMPPPRRLGGTSSFPKPVDSATYSAPGGTPGTSRTQGIPRYSPRCGAAPQPRVAAIIEALRKNSRKLSDIKSAGTAAGAHMEAATTEGSQEVPCECTVGDQQTDVSVSEVALHEISEDGEFMSRSLLREPSVTGSVVDINFRDSICSVLPRTSDSAVSVEFRRGISMLALHSSLRGAAAAAAVAAVLAACVSGLKTAAACSRGDESSQRQAVHVSSPPKRRNGARAEYYSRQGRHASCGGASPPPRAPASREDGARSLQRDEEVRRRGLAGKERYLRDQLAEAAADSLEEARRVDMRERRRATAKRCATDDRLRTAQLVLVRRSSSKRLVRVGCGSAAVVAVAAAVAARAAVNLYGPAFRPALRRRAPPIRTSADTSPAASPRSSPRPNDAANGEVRSREPVSSKKQRPPVHPPVHASPPLISGLDSLCRSTSVMSRPVPGYTPPTTPLQSASQSPEGSPLARSMRSPRITLQQRTAFAALVKRRLRQMEREESGPQDGASPLSMPPEEVSDEEAQAVVAAYCEGGLGESAAQWVTSVRSAVPARARSTFMALCGDDRPKAVFHGITTEPTEERLGQIMAQGLDPRLCKAAMFGRGAYVATDGAKALMYAAGGKWDRRRQAGQTTILERHSSPLAVLAGVLAPGDFTVGEKGAEHVGVTADSMQLPTQFCIPVGQEGRLLLTHVITLDLPGPDHARGESISTFTRRGDSANQRSPLRLSQASHSPPASPPGSATYAAP